MENVSNSTDYRTFSSLLISLTGSSRVFDSGFCGSRTVLQLLHNSGSLGVPAAAPRCFRRGCRFRGSPVRTLNAQPSARPTEDEKQRQAGCHCSEKKAKDTTQRELIFLLLSSPILLRIDLWRVEDYVSAHYRHSQLGSGDEDAKKTNKQFIWTFFHICVFCHISPT